MSRRMTDSRALARARVELGPTAAVERSTFIGPLPIWHGRCRIMKLAPYGIGMLIVGQGHTWEDAFADYERAREADERRWRELYAERDHRESEAP